MLVEQRLLALGNLIGFLFLVTYSGNNNMTIRQKLYFLGVIAILGIVALLVRHPILKIRAMTLITPSNSLVI